MRVGLVTGRERIELKEFPEPVPEPGKAVVEIAYCGICGTDIHPFQTGDPYNPAICGHEWTGTVSALGRGVAGLKVGDRVGIGATPACGQCAGCRAGDAAHCTAVLMAMVGVGPLAPLHGGFARAIAVFFLESPLAAEHLFGESFDARDARLVAGPVAGQPVVTQGVVLD